MIEADPKTRQVARNAFHDTVEATEEHAVDPLVQLLQHPDPAVRRQAATELGDLATPALEELTESAKETVSTTGEVVGEKLQPVAEKAKEISEQTAEKASEAIDTTKTKVEEVQREKPFSERVREGASAVEHRLYPTAEKAKDTGGDAAHEASETLKKSTETVKGDSNRSKSGKTKH